MRIGILTYHRSINCGAVMQCYSLSKKLQQCLPQATVEVVDYHMPLVDEYYDNEMKNYFSGNGLAFLARKCAKWLLEGGYKWHKARKDAFEMVRGQLPLSPEAIYDNGTDRLFAYINDRYDIIIAGSDAIWNYKMRGFPNPYYLSDRIQIPKMSYAASCHGMNYEAISDEEKAVISKILQSYQFIGVRDDESYRFASQLGVKVNPIHTCDPTVFLDVDDLPIDKQTLRIKLERKGFDFTKKAIGFMGGYNMCSMIRRLFGKEYQIVSLYTFCRIADVNLYDLTPYEWAYVFRYFSLTFTTYFHGMLLSLRNGIPVICIALDDDYANKYKAKAIDFLERIDMGDCYFKTDYKQKNIDSIKKKAVELLSADCQDQIIQKMEIEAQTFMPFLTRLIELSQTTIG